MNTTLRSATIWAIIVLAGICGAATTAHAQQPTAPPSTVAVIDVSVIFKDHPRFIAMMNDWKKDFQAAQGQSRTKQNEFAAKRQQLSSLTAGSQRYKDLDVELLKMESDLRYDVNRIKKEFMEREVKIYHDVFTEVATITERFARRHGILLVMRYNSAKVTGEQRSVYQGINRNVVFQDNIDITADIQAELQRQYPGRRPSGGPIDPGKFGGQAGQSGGNPLK